MSAFWIGLAIGLVLGTAATLLMLGLCWASAKGDADAERLLADAALKRINRLP